MSQTPQAPTPGSNDIVKALTVLAFCQLVGEGASSGVALLIPGIAFPGPVAGMLLLFCILLLRGQVSRGISTASNGLLGLLSLLFIPSAVGIVQHGSLIPAWGIPLLIGIVTSTVATLIVTVAAFLAADRWARGKDHD